jgi:hypothetical protein
MSGMAEESLGHRASADVAGANKENCFHSCITRATMGRDRKIVNG